MNLPDDSLLKIFIDHTWEAVVAIGLLISTMARLLWVQNAKMVDANAEATAQALAEHKLASEKAMVEHRITSEKAMLQHQELNARMHSDTKTELSIHRQHIAKLFENAEKSRENLANQLVEMRADTNDRLLAISDTQAKQHVALLTAIHQVANAKRDK